MNHAGESVERSNGAAKGDEPPPSLGNLISAGLNAPAVKSLFLLRISCHHATALFEPVYLLFSQTAIFCDRKHGFPAALYIDRISREF